MFKTRLLSGIVLVIVLIVTVGYGGNLLFAFLGIISLIGLTELYKVVEVQKKALGTAGYLAAIVYYGLLLTEEDFQVEINRTQVVITFAGEET